jgi:hypothetical protein
MMRPIIVGSPGDPFKQLIAVKTKETLSAEDFQ